MDKVQLIGPFCQILTMNGLPDKGCISDSMLEVAGDAGILIRNGCISKIGHYDSLWRLAQSEGAQIEQVDGKYAVLPGLIDAHTHICYAGSRAGDYAKRLSGMSYLEIAEQGGGIWSTVSRTREATYEQLLTLTRRRAETMLEMGITTAEVKSGYDLTLEGEIRILKIIRQLNELLPIDLISTCLAAHMTPRDFQGTPAQYLEYIATELFPRIKSEKLSHRIDIFIERSAFQPEDSMNYLRIAKEMGFDITVHADQFTAGGSEIACKLGAVSADHLEASASQEIMRLAQSNTVTVCLPGASIGLGLQFAPARKLLDAGATLAIASDWNPGSAPMGDLLMQACVLGAYEHLSLAETIAAITVRAAKALNLGDRGVLRPGMWADFIAFPTDDYREIIYRQGMLKPAYIWKKGGKIINHQ